MQYDTYFVWAKHYILWGSTILPFYHVALPVFAKLNNNKLGTFSSAQTLLADHFQLSPSLSRKLQHYYIKCSNFVKNKGDRFVQFNKLIRLDRR